jgi:NNP family nitrate/nitrite transporter-like MFS transporter
VPQATFGVLFVVTAIAAVWMHLTVMRLLHTASPELADKFEHESGAPAGLVTSDTKG